MPFVPALRACARTLLPAALLATLSTGCTRSEAGEAAQGVWKPGEGWQLVEEARIGSADGDGADVFAWIVDVELDAMGRAWIADGQQHRIQVFDSTGAHVRTIGRKGGGPQEFNGIAGMDWAADGTLWVLDGGNMRFAVYDSAGRFITTHRRDVNVVTSPWPLGFDATGSLYDLASVGTEENAPEQVVRFGPGLQPRDTFRVPPYEEPVFEVVRQEGNNRSVNRVNVPFAPDQIWRLDPQGAVWVAVTDRYRLTRYRFDGTVDRVVERDAQPQPVTAEQRQKVLASYRQFEQSGGRVDESRIPKTHPLISTFFIAKDGHLWVIPFRGKTLVADVFTPAGAYLGEVSFPGRFAPAPAPAIRGDRMLYVVRDEDGVPSVLLARIQKPGR